MTLAFVCSACHEVVLVEDSSFRSIADHLKSKHFEEVLEQKPVSFSPLKGLTVIN